MRKHYERAWRSVDALQLDTAPRVDARRFAGLGRGARVLDVGAGHGVVARALGERFASVVALDLVARARSSGEAVVADLDEALPFGDGTFDAVVALDVIEHLFDPVMLLSEAARVLGPRGRLLVETPNARYHRYLSDLVAGRVPVTVDRTALLAGLPPPHHGHVSPWTGPDLARALVALGFADVACEGFGWDRSLRGRAVALAAGRDARATGLRALATRSDARWVGWRWDRIDVVTIGTGAGPRRDEEAGVRVMSERRIASVAELPAALAAHRAAHVLVVGDAQALRPGAIAALRAAFASDPAVAVASGERGDGCLLADVSALARAAAVPHPARPIEELDAPLAAIGRSTIRAPYAVREDAS